MGTNAKKDTLRIESNGIYNGVVDKNNKIVVPFEYDKITVACSSGLIYVCKKDKWGCLDLEGNVVISLKYDWISGLCFSSGCIVKQGKKYGVVNRNGETIVPIEYYRIECGLGYNTGYYILDTGKKKGLCNAEGKELIPVCCGNIQIISKESAIVVKDEKKISLFL